MGQEERTYKKIGNRQNMQRDEKDNEEEGKQISTDAEQQNKLNDYDDSIDLIDTWHIKEAPQV